MRDRDAGRLSDKRGPIGIVIVGEDDAGHAGRHAIALDKRARRRGQHDAGPVIIGKGDRPLDRAGGEDRPAWRAPSTGDGAARPWRGVAGS